MKYNLVKILLVANSLLIAAAFVYFAFEYSNWDITIVLFLLFVYAIIIMLIYNWVDRMRIKEEQWLASILAEIKVAATKMLEDKKKVVVREPHYTIDNKAENDQKRFSNSYPSLGHIGEDEHDPLTECERNNAVYMAKHASEN